MLPSRSCRKQTGGWSLKCLRLLARLCTRVLLLFSLHLSLLSFPSLLLFLSLLQGTFLTANLHVSSSAGHCGEIVQEVRSPTPSASRFQAMANYLFICLFFFLFRLLLLHSHSSILLYCLPLFSRLALCTHTPAHQIRLRTHLFSTP